MYIDSIINLKPVSRISEVYFHFYKQNSVFQVNVMFDGQKWEPVSIKQIGDHVSYLENHLELVAQIFTTSSFCKFVWFELQNVFNIVAKENLQRKICFPYMYTAKRVTLVYLYHINRCGHHKKLLIAKLDFVQVCGLSLSFYNNTLRKFYKFSESRET